MVGRYRKHRIGKTSTDPQERGRCHGQCRFTGVGQGGADQEAPSKDDPVSVPEGTDQAPHAEHFVNYTVPAKLMDCVIIVWLCLWDFSFKGNSFQTFRQNVLRRTLSFPGKKFLSAATQDFYSTSARSQALQTSEERGSSFLHPHTLRARVAGTLRTRPGSRHPMLDHLGCNWSSPDLNFPCFTNKARARGGHPPVPLHPTPIPPHDHESFSGDRASLC